MTWEEDLELVVERTKVERYRYLCSPEYPNHMAYRALMIQMATEPAPPTLWQKVGRLFSEPAVGVKKKCGGCGK